MVNTSKGGKTLANFSPIKINQIKPFGRVVLRKSDQIKTCGVMDYAEIEALNFWTREDDHTRPTLSSIYPI